MKMLNNKTLLLFVVGVVVVFAADAGERVSGFGKNEFRLLGLKDSVVLTPQNIPAFETKCILQADVAAARAIFISCEGQAYMTGSNVGPTGGFVLTANSNLETPAIVQGLSDHKLLMGAVGDQHAVALTDSGRVFTWGANNKGQLGFGAGSVTVAKEPTELLALSRKNIRMVAAGANRTAALTDDGQLYMWGEGEMGEMGDGLGKTHTKPTLVKSLNNNGQRVCQIAIGGSHVAAVTNAGDLYTWGNNNQGQLGLGEFGGIKKRPTPVGRLRKNACHVSTGNDFTSTITQDSRMFMWGSDGYPGPFEKTWFQGMNPRQAAAGKGHMVVLLANSSVVTWGNRKEGQAGRTFSGDFTLEPGLVDIDGVGQLAVGVDSTFLLKGSTPAPSLCPCLNEYYMFWRTKVEFQPTCKEGQSVCGDGSCCEQGSTCCRFGDGEVKSIVSPRAIDSRAMDSPYFKCVKAENANCCDGYGCESGYKCWGEPKCVPHWAHKGMGFEDLVERSSDALSFRVPARSPGFNANVGVCGARKVTCPDDSCCAIGSTCCSKPDGSFGCCAHQNAQCCDNGCCREGYSCDNDRQTCVKKESGSVASQTGVTGQCGANKMTCPDRSCCGSGKTCCVLNDGFFGCCPFTNGVCCADGAGCCPGKHTCDVENSKCVLQTGGEFGEDAIEKEVSIPMRSTPRNTPSRPAVSEVKCAHDTVCQYPGSCCESNGKSTCCDFLNGTCCAGGLGCCPSGFSCDLENSQCKPAGKNKAMVPMKFTRDAQTARAAMGQEKPVCVGKTQCEDNSCCPLGSSCCAGPNGKTTCCSSMTGVCCRDGGCCSEGDTCDEASYGCVSRTGEKYGHLSTQETSKPSPNKKIRDVAAPGKCYADERSCGDGMCCPRAATCCDRAFGQKSCCPATHGVCCGNGGCCPGGSTCDLANLECSIDGKSPTKMLMSEPSNAAEAEWDVEECWDDEQTCALDGGCCLKSETCCGVHDESGAAISACCPFKNAVCCDGGNGCCPEGSVCDVEMGTCRKPGGSEVALQASRGSAVHPLSGMSEKDCPDGSICNAQDTCCSLGFDEYWGEVIYACCPFENAVCCSEFEGCCPNGYACDAETRSCITEGRTIVSADSAKSETAPNYVCLWPEAQCPNGKCCDKDDVCAQTAAGAYRCVDRGHVTCGNGSHACPEGTICDQRNGVWLCGVVEDTAETVKAEMLKKYWGDDTEAACNSILLQTSAQQVQQRKATSQFWYPKTLAIKAKAVQTSPATLPTLLVAKICQHLNMTEGSAGLEHCFESNTNGHFVVAERERVAALLAEYIRRVTVQQDTVALASEKFVAEPEELDPCPCREKPDLTSDKVDDVETVAGSDDSSMTEVLDAVASKESETATTTTTTDKNSTKPKPQFIPPTDMVADEKVVTSIGGGMGKASSGSVPLSAETVVDAEEETKLTLVRTVSDAMQTATSEATPSNSQDKAMQQAKKVETFMGKEGCDDDDEDGAEEAVDLDTNNKLEEDVEQVSLAQLNAQPTNGDAGSLMPEM